MTLVLAGLLALSAGCASLSPSDRADLQKLEAQGIRIDAPKGNFQSPNSKAVAGVLNLLPGIGNFYLAVGRGADTSQVLFGLGNFLMWPMSIVWGVPEAVIDAGTLNNREMVYHYRFNPEGRRIAEEAGVSF
ncbi:MAG: hypothetical protein J6Y19_03715 [Kiritimatiellae bacterium]|nr:hypothetical protein [Kiritimatiellia bacterium]